jgi:serine protease Do
MSSTPRRMLWISLTLAGLIPTLLAAQEITREEGYDRRGNDYSSFRARSLSGCVEACRDDRRCRAYTYDTRDGTCYLKDRVNSSQRNDAMVTGYKRDDSGDSDLGLTEERGYDRRGSDYTSFRARDLSDCMGACRKDDRCRAYTYDTRNDVCYLKDRVSSAQRDDAMVTGYKREDD